MGKNSNMSMFYVRLFIILVLVVMVGRLFYIQVFDDTMKRTSLRNSVKEVVRYPSRGEMFDRNGKMVVQNIEAYDIMVVPRELKAFDTLQLAKILQMEVEEIKNRINKARNYSSRKESSLVSQLSHKEKLMVEELAIAGFSFVAHPVRTYPYKSVAHVVGYMGEVSQNEINNDPYYLGGDYAGRTGLEAVYENEIRGEKGYMLKLVDVHGVVRGDYLEGKDNSNPVSGRKIYTTLDADLQELGVRLMNGKVGAIVAIEPATGEVLAMITAPTYNPDSLVGAAMRNNYRALSNNPRRPLFNRTVMGGYPPGSTFKMANALVSLEEGVVTPYEKFECNMGWEVPGRRVKCHYHAPSTNMELAIQVSCNAYFCYTFRRMMRNNKYKGTKPAFDAWSESVRRFGFGVNFDTDIPGVQRGFVPNSDFYNKMYGGYWNDVTIISLSIGQGEITASPLQLANFTAILANRGYYKVPHLVREIEGGMSELAKERIAEVHESGVNPRYFDLIVDAMWKGVNEYGTGTANSAAVRDLDICGKSGTAQNSKGADHSTYVAFAPKINPKIAIAVYVEHGGWGGTVALPIATLMIEQYMRGEIRREELLAKIENMVIDYPVYDNITTK